MIGQKLLVINPGSTSTKIAAYEGEQVLWEKKVAHSYQALKGYDNVIEQLSFRKEAILEAMAEERNNGEKYAAIVGRGGLLHPVASGAYLINEEMLEDLRSCRYGEHASNLGALIAQEIAREYGVSAYIIDPVVVDEFEPVARLSGLPEVPRRSIFHALNQKAIARKYCKEQGRRYEETNLIVVHIGGGTSIGAHCKGSVIDVSNGLDGEGPFSPERTGALPIVETLRYFVDHQYDFDGMRRRLVGNGGLAAYLQTNDAQKVEEMICAGDENAKLVFSAMAYQIAKEIGAYAVVLKGRQDAVLITGGLANSKMLVDMIIEQVQFLGNIHVYPGEDEMLALASGAVRIVSGEEEAKTYTKWTDKG